MLLKKDPVMVLQLSPSPVLTLLQKDPLMDRHLRPPSALKLLEKDHLQNLRQKYNLLDLHLSSSCINVSRDGPPPGSASESSSRVDAAREGPSPGFAYESSSCSNTAPEGHTSGSALSNHPVLMLLEKDPSPCTVSEGLFPKAASEEHYPRSVPETSLCTDTSPGKDSFWVIRGLLLCQHFI
ncbi:hypothetical protein llap_20570 [Limosa lapponica baueri]|uniref:Uncharacterized protein n=1 Tax=Limosa lapponica baueri TaxID=1758121 RepID=A0A2I0T5P8_LIMLA|nr:hypothetical protein llap_20570 [Limosa lapponica baueri]